jgi:hypothetical protein
MNCDPQGSNDVNVQDGALVHKAPLRPVGRSSLSVLVSAEVLSAGLAHGGRAPVSYAGGAGFETWSQHQFAGIAQRRALVL